MIQPDLRIDAPKAPNAKKKEVFQNDFGARLNIKAEQTGSSDSSPSENLHDQPHKWENRSGPGILTPDRLPPLGVRGLVNGKNGKLAGETKPRSRKEHRGTGSTRIRKSPDAFWGGRGVERKNDTRSEDPTRVGNVKRKDKVISQHQLDPLQKG